MLPWLLLAGTPPQSILARLLLTSLPLTTPLALLLPRLRPPCTMSWARLGSLPLVHVTAPRPVRVMLMLTSPPPLPIVVAVIIGVRLRLRPLHLPPRLLPVAVAVLLLRLHLLPQHLRLRRPRLRLSPALSCRTGSLSAPLSPPCLLLRVGAVVSTWTLTPLSLPSGLGSLLALLGGPHRPSPRSLHLGPQPLTSPGFACRSS